MTCSICSSIGDSARANTGREEHFGPPITSLEPNRIEASDDLWECPECNAVFVWQDYTAQTGSGNNDEETLERVPPEIAAWVRAFLHRGDRSPAEVAQQAGRLTSMRADLRDLVLAHVRGRDRELAAGLVPWMLDAVGRPGHAWAHEFLEELAVRDQAAVVMSELSRRPPRPEHEKLRAHCKCQLCSICRPIESFRATKARRDRPLPPPLDSLLQLGISSELDVWECPECGSIFRWESKDGIEGSLRRTSEPLASAMRACTHRKGVVPDADIEMVFACAESQVVLTHAVRNDRELARQLVPRTIKALSSYEQPWQHDLLARFVEGAPSDAKIVLDAIATAPRTNRALEKLADRCRRILTVRRGAGDDAFGGTRTLTRLTRSIFVGETVAWSSDTLGPIELGVVDASAPGVAEGVSRLLVRSIQDARAEVGGHLPAWLVRDIERNYISPERVRTLWAEAGHRFAMLAGGEIIATVHVARRHDVILTADRAHNNVPEHELPGLKPLRHHQVVNVSVRHELRNGGLAAKMFEHVTTSFRARFDGDGLWVRADPPWHPWLVRLGFVHDPTYDVFLPEEVETTAGLPHPAFNLLYACACEGAHTPARLEAMRSKKLQYVSLTRAFVATSGVERATAADVTERPRTADDLAATLARATREGRRVAIHGAGSGPEVPRADATVATGGLGRIDVQFDRVRAGAGATWRELLAALPEGRTPPVVPGYVNATIGGSLSTGGIGKGSVRYGLAIDHVHELLVATRDGRLVACSRDRDRWLYDAALGSGGAFGAIVEATLPLVTRAKRVVIEKSIVARGTLAAALDIDALHAFATKTPDGWLVVVARESGEGAGVPLAAFLTPVRERSNAREVAQTFVDAPSLGALLAEREIAVEPGRELTVHPVRRGGRLQFAVTGRVVAQTDHQ